MNDALTIDKILEAKRLIESVAPAKPAWDGLIRESPHLTVSKSRVRPWRERLFSWPWKPWQRVHVWQEPDPQVYLIPWGGSIFAPSKPDRKTLIAHPVTAARIRQQLR